MSDGLGRKNVIGFWGYPCPEVVSSLKQEHPNAKWIDLDVDFDYPDASILPEAYCKIIKNIINNAIYLKDSVLKIVAAIGKEKCDSGWFAAQVLKDLGFDVVETIYELTYPQKEILISTSDMPLIEKVTMITDSIINPIDKSKIINQCEAKFGFWGVPPNDLEILKLFPDNTHVFGWTRCVEAGTPADVKLEMYVDKNIPTVFYSQAFCAKSQLAKYLADKYNGLHVDIDDYSTNSVKAKIEAFLRLR